jgi:hypothetical protein
MSELCPSIHEVNESVGKFRTTLSWTTIQIVSLNEQNIKVFIQIF